MDTKLTQEQYDRLIYLEEHDPRAPDLRIPIPADGWVKPSDYCYKQDGEWHIEDCAVQFLKQRGIEL